MRRALRTWEQPISILQARINFNLYNYHVERHTYRYNVSSIPFWVTEMDKSGNRHEKVEREFEDLEVGSAHNRVGSRVTTLSHVRINKSGADNTYALFLRRWSSSSLGADFR